MGKHDDLITFAVGGIALYFMLKTCMIQDLVNKMMATAPGGNPMASLFDQINQVIGASCAAGTGTTPAPGGGGGATVTGDAPYAMIGSPETLETSGQGTRHYRSGAPDDVTQEWRGETTAQNYMILYDITLTEIDHDDTITVKFGGTHNGSGWYGAQYTFEAGQAAFGAEESHPNFSDCLEGTAIGTFVNTRRKVAVVNIGKGERLEEWSHNGTAWQKDVESLNGVCGFRPNVDEDEIAIRIDGAPGIDMHSAVHVEIDPASSGGGGTTTPPPAGGTTPPPTNGEDDEEDEESNYARSFYIVPTREPSIFYHWSSRLRL